MSWVNKALKGFFWFAFASFLAASIPHVAYFFRAFEPQATVGQDPLFYWGIAYALAISIDVMIVLLSVTVAQLKHQRVGRGTIFSIWTFIGKPAASRRGLFWKPFEQQSARQPRYRPTLPFLC